MPVPTNDTEMDQPAGAQQPDMLNLQPEIDRKRRARKRILGIAVLAIIVVAVVAGAVYGIRYTAQHKSAPAVDQYGIPTSHVTYDWAHARPEGTLYYPGAKEVSKFGSTMGVDGSAVAGSGAVLSVNASPDQIYAWYATWLLTHGWQHGAGLGLLSSQTSLQNYVKSGSREIFYVAMDDAANLAKYQGIKSDPGMTVFEISYGITPGSGQ